MKINVLYILVLTGLVLGSCKKLQSPLSGTENAIPIYKMAGEIDDGLANFTVDNSKIVMRSGYEKQDRIPSYYTIFEDKENNTSIKFSITSRKKGHDIQQMPTEDKDMNFLVHEPGRYKFGFDNPPPNVPIVSFLNNNHFISTTAITFNEYGIYDLDLKFKGQSSRTFKQTINHGFNDGQNGDFEIYNLNSGIYFGCIGTGNTHQWFLDGNKESDKSHDTLFISTGIHSLRHIETDPLGNVKEFSRIFYVGQGSLRWTFTTDLEQDIPEHNNFDHITITYVKDGIAYTSFRAYQNHSNIFAIKNIEYFNEDENSDVVSLKFDVSFDAVLYSETGEKMELKNFIGTCKYVLK